MIKFFEKLIDRGYIVRVCMHVLAYIPIQRQISTSPLVFSVHLYNSVHICTRTNASNHTQLPRLSHCEVSIVFVWLIATKIEENMEQLFLNQ